MVDNVELDCAAYELTAASIGHGHGDSVFRCTLSPVSDAVLATLNAAARSNRRVRFAFPDRPLLLERIEVEPAEPGKVRIVGRVVSGTW